MLVYSSDNYDGPAIDLTKINATKAWLKHKENEAILKFFITKGTRVEKVEASLELVICERKLKYWEHAHNFDKDEAIRMVAKLDKNWSDK